MKVIIIGEKYKQSQKLQYILDNIENCEIQFINVEKQLQEQIEKIQTNQRSSRITNIIFEMKKSNTQEQESLIYQLKKVKRLFFPLNLLISDDYLREDAINIKNQLNRYHNIYICNLVDFFQKNYGYDKQVDLSGKKIAIFLTKEQDVKTKIFQTVKSPAILQNNWALINTPQCKMNSEIEQQNEVIIEFQQIFKRYQSQISFLFIIIDQERNDRVKKNFMDIYSQFKKLKKQIIVLLYNRMNEEFEENLALDNFFMNVAKIRKVYSLTNDQLQNQQSINQYFNQVLQEHQNNLEVGIDLKDTIFELRDEKQCEADNITFQQDLINNQVQNLKQRVEQADQQIILYQQKIAELEKSKKEDLNQIREFESQISQNQKTVEKVQNETLFQSQNSREVRMPQPQGFQNNIQNQEVIKKKNGESLQLDIQTLEKYRQSLNNKLDQCYKKQDIILQNKTSFKQGNESQKLEKLLESEITDLWNKIDETDCKIRENNNQLQKLQQDFNNNQQNLEQGNNASNYQFSANIKQINPFHHQENKNYRRL
ncbi:unnamed protein product [Paramecium octaurelia]|uniref:Uncharacterized protein n=1 Tax=Paramecium octaurelia TaxID=43137 RepID=A0A8S1XKC9_PAROT|nr:unnamed protein product [Paramecium octaurelia]